MLRSAELALHLEDLFCGMRTMSPSYFQRSEMIECLLIKGIRRESIQTSEGTVLKKPPLKLFCSDKQNSFIHSFNP